MSAEKRKEEQEQKRMAERRSQLEQRKSERQDVFKPPKEIDRAPKTTAGANRSIKDKRSTSELVDAIVARKRKRGDEEQGGRQGDDQIISAKRHKPMPEPDHRAKRGKQSHKALKREADAE